VSHAKGHCPVAAAKVAQRCVPAALLAFRVAARAANAYAARDQCSKRLKRVGDATKLGRGGCDLFERVGGTPQARVFGKRE